MHRLLFGLALTMLIAVPATAQQSVPPLTPDQKGYIVYDQCMMHAAIKASRTDAKDEEIFGLAKAQCAVTRVQVLIGQENNRGFIAALDAADADKAAKFPAWIKGVRERRKAYDLPAPAPRP